MASWNGPPRSTSVSDKRSNGWTLESRERPAGRKVTGLSRRSPAPRLLVAVVVVLSMLPVSTEAQTQVLDRILAVVDGQVIMWSDVRAFLDLQLVEIPPGSDPESYVLSYLIERRLVLDQVDRFVAEPASELVDRRFALVEDRVAGSEALAAILDRVGLTSDDLRQLLADDIRRDVYLADRFAAVDDERREQAESDWVASLVRRAQVRRVQDSSR